jgi:hypothetical protein
VCSTREAFNVQGRVERCRKNFKLLSLYQQFEYVVVLILTAFIAIIVVAALWSLSLKSLFGLVLSGSLDPSDYAVFQAVFGMIFR